MLIQLHCGKVEQLTVCLCFLRTEAENRFGAFPLLIYSVIKVHCFKVGKANYM